jgi:uncharacterized protein
VSDPSVLLLVVGAYAFVQSIFGVGLLVFGTPTLLLLGFSFEEVLAYLLPCSLAISALQVRTTRFLPLELIRRQFLLYTVPAVIVGALTVLVFLRDTINIKPFVGTLLIVTAVLRTPSGASGRLKRVIGNHRPVFLTGLGIVHGLTNLGGGLLTVIVGSLFSEKRAVRGHIAFGYGLMAISQLIVLYVTKDPHVRWLTQALLVLAAASMYLTVGERTFKATKQAIYQRALTALIATFGIVLLIG